MTKSNKYLEKISEAHPIDSVGGSLVGTGLGFGAGSIAKKLKSKHSIPVTIGGALLGTYIGMKGTGEAREKVQEAYHKLRNTERFDVPNPVYNDKQ